MCKIRTEAIPILIESAAAVNTFTFLDGIDPDLSAAFLEKLRVHWTHTSTAIEGNTLTAGETLEVLSKGLTISGKPLNDHNEVVGHSHAIDLILQMCRKGEAVSADDLFRLHAAVQTQAVVDSMSPIGAWKIEPNSSAVVIDGEVVTNDTYADPREVPTLMNDWLDRLNTITQLGFPDEDARFQGYAWLHAAIVRIHPFADGNGRVARLTANLPLLRWGFPPVTIPLERRVEYIETLVRWQLASGRPRPGADLVPETAEFQAFIAFCRDVSGAVQSLVEETLQRQRERDSGR